MRLRSGLISVAVVPTTNPDEFVIESHLPPSPIKPRRYRYLATRRSPGDTSALARLTRSQRVALRAGSPFEPWARPESLP